MPSGEPDDTSSPDSLFRQSCECASRAIMLLHLFGEPSIRLCSWIAMAYAYLAVAVVWFLCRFLQYSSGTCIEYLAYSMILLTAWVAWTESWFCSSNTPSSCCVSYATLIWAETHPTLWGFLADSRYVVVAIRSIKALASRAVASGNQNFKVAMIEYLQIITLIIEDMNAKQLAKALNAGLIEVCRMCDSLNLLMAVEVDKKATEGSAGDFPYLVSEAWTTFIGVMVWRLNCLGQFQSIDTRSCYNIRGECPMINVEKRQLRRRCTGSCWTTYGHRKLCHSASSSANSGNRNLRFKRFLFLQDYLIRQNRHVSPQTRLHIPYRRHDFCVELDYTNGRCVAGVAPAQDFTGVAPFAALDGLVRIAGELPEGSDIAFLELKESHPAVFQQVCELAELEMVETYDGDDLFI
ncbi:hypothetical protein R3P38DRAFT_3147017 [Favolaschia claudopus]|uniref:Uncharacterized protein n=1 Tax=Favolaschia claudopus TaxID=2862362 RepID=A0AAV9Z2Q8_9AGAR